MRIIGGRFRGLALATVGKGDEAAHLRPTTDRVRESLFGMLEGGRFGDPVEGAVVLDLFAGTGALGLEALSRGAASATFVENGRTALKVLTANIAKTRAGDLCRVLRRDATRIGPVEGALATLVFLDPPYGSGLGVRALAQADRGGWIAPDALIVCEDETEMEPPEGFLRVDARRFGATWLTFLRPEDK